MVETEMGQTAGKKIAFVIASNAIGGHEFQSRALVDDFARFVQVTVYLNRETHRSLFDGAAACVSVETGLFLEPGWLGRQMLNGLRRRREIRQLLKGYDHIVVCAGTVEAGVCTSIALSGRGNVSLYLPFFYDRTVLWGKIGCLYNLILGRFGTFYRNIITINRIQARLIRGFMHRPTTVVPNLVRDVSMVQRKGPGRILCICRLDRQKRIPELLRWLDFDDNPYKEILIIGDGPQKEEIAQTSRSLRHIQTILLGWKWPAEQDEIISASDVLVLNSIIEGEPLVLNEAIKRGILVLARDIPGVRGVTTRSSRFSNQGELRTALLTPSSRIATRTLPARNRDRAVQRLIAQIAKPK